MSRKSKPIPIKNSACKLKDYSFYNYNSPNLTSSPIIQINTIKYSRNPNNPDDPTNPKNNSFKRIYMNLVADTYLELNDS